MRKEMLRCLQAVKKEKKPCAINTIILSKFIFSNEYTQVLGM